MKDVIVFYPEDFQQFIAALKDAVAENIRGYVVEKPMTIKEAAEYFIVSEATFRNRIRKGIIPAELVHHAAGSMYFLPSELHAFLKRS